MLVQATKTLLFILLTTFAFITIQALKCPTQGSISPCKCSLYNSHTVVTCTNIEDADTLYNEIQKFRSYPIDILKLDKVSVPYLPANLFSGLSVKVLNFDFCHLDNWYSIKNVNATPFEGLETTLQSIDFDYTTIPSNSYWPNMTQFTKVEYLFLESTPVSIVDRQLAEIGGGSLRYFTALDSKIDKIDPHAFRNVVKLENVNFVRDQLRYLVRTMFPNPAFNLERLCFSENRISTLDNNMFENMPVLKELYLDRNELKQFNYNAFIPVLRRQLKLYIYGNPFKCECSLKPLRLLLESKKVTLERLEKLTCIKETKIKDIDFTSMCKK